MKRIAGAEKSTRPSPKSESKQFSTDESPADPRFSKRVIEWQKQHGRHKLPWQNTRDAYRIWLSEIMLQQTQVATVIPYYERFLLKFPDVQALASAPAEEVMALWSGLGYYSRARNLHRCAQLVCDQYQGVFPAAPELLADLPGIGRSTAAAISAFSYGTRAAIMDGNVKRVFCRVFGIDGYPGEKPVEQALWRRAEALLPNEDLESYTQGLMDLGASICSRNKPTCQACPLAGECIALASGRVEQLPVRKPKKAIPEKHAVMLVLENSGQVLLQLRPDVGIWGGLLSLPELDSHFCAMPPDRNAVELSAAIEAAAASFGSVESCSMLQPFTHTFTHFKLHIAPYRIRLSQRLHKVAQDTHVWYDFERLAQAPLPAPVKKLLLELFDKEEDLLSSLS